MISYQSHLVIPEGSPPSKGIEFCVDSRYSKLELVGAGAFGTVVSAYDRVTNMKVAIKKITRALHEPIDLKRILREVTLLRLLQHENVVQLLDVFGPPPKSPMDAIYIVTGMMESDMSRIIKSRQPLTEHHVQYFMFQALRAMEHLHAASVIHRDIKPQNLLVNRNCDLRVCDLGLARTFDEEKASEDLIKDGGLDGGGMLTEYVVTRWYRAPEVMLCSREYGKALDIWGLGCVMAEMMTRRCLFPGKDYIHQIKLIMELLGFPEDPNDLEFITNNKAKDFIISLKIPVKPRAEFDRNFPNASPLACDILHKLLAFNPAKRISAAEALQHPFFKDLHDATIAAGSSIHSNVTPVTHYFPFRASDALLETRLDIEHSLYAELKVYRPQLPVKFHDCYMPTEVYEKLQNQKQVDNGSNNNNNNNSNNNNLNINHAIPIAARTSSGNPPPVCPPQPSQFHSPVGGKLYHHQQQPQSIVTNHLSGQSHHLHQQPNQSSSLDRSHLPSSFPPALPQQLSSLHSSMHLQPVGDLPLSFEQDEVKGNNNSNQKNTQQHLSNERIHQHYPLNAVNSSRTHQRIPSNSNYQMYNNNNLNVQQSSGSGLVSGATSGSRR